MKVKDLIKALKRYPREFEVRVDDWGEGYEEPCNIRNNLSEDNSKFDLTSSVYPLIIRKRFK